MELPINITFKNMDPSPALEQRIRHKARKLSRFGEHIMHVDVVVEAPHRHQNKGELYEVRIDMTVPGGEILVTRDPGLNQAHEDPHVAVRDAFAAAQRQLEDYVRVRRGKVKSHEVPDHGQVVVMVPEEDYGLLETPDGLQVYFHRNSVLDGAFERLERGAAVRFVLAEGEGEKGPQASTVQPVGSRRYAG